GGHPVVARLALPRAAPVLRAFRGRVAPVIPPAKEHAVRYSSVAAVALGTRWIGGLHSTLHHTWGVAAGPPAAPPVQLERGLVGSGNRRGGGRAHSGRGPQGTTRGVDLRPGPFDGGG